MVDKIKSALWNVYTQFQADYGVGATKSKKLKKAIDKINENNLTAVIDVFEKSGDGLDGDESAFLVEVAEELRKSGGWIDSDELAFITAVHEKAGKLCLEQGRLDYRSLIDLSIKYSNYEEDRTDKLSFNEALESADKKVIETWLNRIKALPQPQKDILSKRIKKLVKLNIEEETIFGEKGQKDTPVLFYFERGGAQKQSANPVSVFEFKLRSLELQEKYECGAHDFGAVSDYLVSDVTTVASAALGLLEEATQNWLVHHGGGVAYLEPESYVAYYTALETGDIYALGNMVSGGRTTVSKHLIQSYIDLAREDPNGQKRIDCDGFSANYLTHSQKILEGKGLKHDMFAVSLSSPTSALERHAIGVIAYIDEESNFITLVTNNEHIVPVSLPEEFLKPAKEKLLRSEGLEEETVKELVGQYLPTSEWANRLQYSTCSRTWTGNPVEANNKD